MAEFIGRRIAVGVGRETVRGTAVTPTNWQKHLELDFKKMTETVKNESAQGVVEKYNDSELTKEWAEGSLTGKITDDTMGLILYGANGTAYDHDFTIQQSNTPTTLTISRQDPITDRDHTMGTVGSLEINCEAGEYAKFTAALFAKKGTTATNTVAYTAENEFTSKHLTVKLAANLAGLGAANAIPVSSIKLTIERSAEPYFAAGSTDPDNITTGSVEITGEMVLRYDAATYEDLHYANTKQALRIDFENTDIDLGGAVYPRVKFDMPQVALDTWSIDQGLDDIVEQTVGFTAEYSITDTEAIEALLTNATATY